MVTPAITMGSLKVDYLEATSFNTPVRHTEWVVYNDDSQWHASGPDADTVFSDADPATVIQYALDRGDTNLVDTVPSSDPITTTIDCGGNDFIGPGVRGSASVYVDTDQADPGFRKTSGGYFGNIWLRGDPSGLTSGDLLWLQDMGRGSVVEDVSMFGTTGNGMVVAGCQQMTFRNITVSRCGDPVSDTWCLYLTNSPTDGLETNANFWVGTHNHGGNDQGGFIAMRADQHVDTDYPRTQMFMGINCENGPQSGSVPLIEVSGRDHVFTHGRLAGLDGPTSVFKCVGGRARNIRISDLNIIGANMDIWQANGLGTASPKFENCYIDVGGAIVLDFYNQSDHPLMVSDCEILGGGDKIQVTASKNAGKTIYLSNTDFTGNIDIQGAPVSVNNVRVSGSWTGDTNGFGPFPVKDDGSFSPAHKVAAPTDANTSANVSGVFTWDFFEQFQLSSLPVPYAYVSDDPGDDQYGISELKFVDDSGDGFYDQMSCVVRDSAGVVVDGTTGNYEVTFDMFIGH